MPLLLPIKLNNFNTIRLTYIYLAKLPKDKNHSNKTCWPNSMPLSQASVIYAYLLNGLELKQVQM